MPAVGDAHRFTVLNVGGIVMPLYSSPPPCPMHPGTGQSSAREVGSRVVVRDGFYGPAGSQRQRYRCYVVPAGGGAVEDLHRFTPDLPREHVHAGETHCDVCEEPTGIHRGEQAAARRTSWNLRIVAQALDRLAGGETYTGVGQWAWEATGRGRSRPVAISDKERQRRAKVKKWAAAARVATKNHTKVPSQPKSTLIAEPAAVAKRRRRVDALGEPLAARKRSSRTKAANSRWHTAADWVEMYSPAIWRPLEAQMLAEDRAEYARRQAMTPEQRLADGRPHVLFLDDLPVYTRRVDSRGGITKSRRAYYVLAAGRVAWAARGTERAPAAPDARGIHLRLLRAWPTNETAAWRLLLEELGYVPGEYEPEFIVADAGSGISKAIAKTFTTSVFIPSLFHLLRNVETALVDLTKGSMRLTDEGKALHPDLAAHLTALSATTLQSMTDEQWRGWWDDLDQILVRLGLPTGPTRLRRDMHLPVVAAALDAIRANPTLPLSTGGYESVLRNTTDSIMTGRSHGFANIERLNFLLDLVVARNRGEFTNLNKIVKALRASVAGTEGWAPQPREVTDAQPATDVRYSSLRDVELMRHLARSRGLI